MHLESTAGGARDGTDSKGKIRPTLVVSRIQPVYQQVADQLCELIVEGNLSPGDRLPKEVDLAAAFGVSRGTVREALRVVASRNLIYATRGASGGTFVAEGDAAALTQYLETGIGLLSGNESISLDELLESRQLLEVPATRLAAERRTNQHLEALRVSLDAESQEVETGTRYYHHRRFHALVLAASGNRLIEVMTLPVFGVIRSRFVAHQSEEFWSEVDDDHVAILDHITAGDGDRAAAAMQEHLLRLNVRYRALEAARRTAAAADGVGALGRRPPG